jgi:hypothetical protein
MFGVPVPRTAYQQFPVRHISKSILQRRRGSGTGDAQCHSRDMSLECVLRDNYAEQQGLK